MTKELMYKALQLSEKINMLESDIEDVEALIESLTLHKMNDCYFYSEYIGASVRISVEEANMLKNVKTAIYKKTKKEFEELEDN